MIPSSGGIFPLNLFLWISRICNKRVPITVGIVPVRSFLPNIKVVKFVNACISVGMVLSGLLNPDAKFPGLLGSSTLHLLLFFFHVNNAMHHRDSF